MNSRQNSGHLCPGLGGKTVLSALVLRDSTVVTCVSDRKEEHLSIHFKSVEGMRPGKGIGKSSSPFPSALASPTEQMGWGTFLFKVLSVCLGGVCLGQAGGRQPGPSPGLASGAFHRRKSGTLEFQDPSFSSHSTSNSQMLLTKSLHFS